VLVANATQVVEDEKYSKKPVADQFFRTFEMPSIKADYLAYMVWTDLSERFLILFFNMCLIDRNLIQFLFNHYGWNNYMNLWNLVVIFGTSKSIFDFFFINTINKRISISCAEAVYTEATQRHSTIATHYAAVPNTSTATRFTR
jgi:hypothetical protein